MKTKPDSEHGAVQSLGLTHQNHTGGRAGISGGARDSRAVSGDSPQTAAVCEFVGGVQIFARTDWGVMRVFSCVASLFPARRRKPHASRVLHPRLAFARLRVFDPSALLQFLAALCVTLLLSVANAAEPLQVKFASAKRADIHRWITIPGTLKANQQATLYAKVAGYLTKVAVDKGDSVKAGQLLGELEVPELLADGKKYEADAKVAEVELSRLLEARKKAPDLVLPQALDKARAASSVALANLERTNTLLHFAKITAPFAGMITGRFVDNGAFVPSATGGSAAQNAAIFTLMDYTTVRAQVAVPETEVPFIRTGLPVKLAPEALPGKTFEATVSRSNGALDESTRTMFIEADIPNADGALRPGMYANVRIAVEKHSGVITVPVEALAMEKTNAFVFKVADGKAKKTAVKLGFNDGANAEIAEGLTDGEGVILVGKTTLNDGQPVKAEAVK